MSFVVDTDVWIRAYQTTYPIDVFPGVWTALENAVRVTGKIRSPRQVLAELGSKKSGIRAWCEALNGLALKETAPVSKIVGEIMTDFPDLLHGATHDAADPWVVAHACVLGHTVVTEETFSAGKPKIPNICRRLNVDCINTIELLRRLKVKLK